MIHFKIYVQLLKNLFCNTDIHHYYEESIEAFEGGDDFGRKYTLNMRVRTCKNCGKCQMYDSMWHVWDTIIKK